MRTISADQARLIDDARAEGLVALPAAIFEKDILVTEALRIIARSAFRDITFVFSGGTALAKAYKLLHRMSEDADLRLVLANQEKLSRSAIKRRLSDVKHALTDTLRAAEFNLPDGAAQARNENRKLAFTLGYESRYPPEASLRPDVQLEFMAIAPRLGTVQHTIRPLIDELTNRQTAELFELSCIAVEETYTEKVISYLRRAGEHLSGRQPSQYEERHARHVYDVHQIASEYFGRRQMRPPAPKFVAELIRAEAALFGSRDEAFGKDPLATLRATLVRIDQHKEFRQHYDRFTRELLYGDERPTFDQAFGTFKQAAEALLASAAS